MTGRVAVPAGESPDRAQAEVLGVVLLLGLVAVGSLSLMLVATGAVSDTQSEAEMERVEQSFVQVSQTMATATTDGDMPRAVSFDAGESGAVTKTDAGTITIQGGNVDVTRTVGAVEYRHDDGSVVAYQAGAVFAERGNQTRVLSEPPISYDPVDKALTLPITDMSESQDLSSGPIHVSKTTTDPLREASFVKNDTVTLTIQSPYYRGWEEFFRSSAGDGSIESINHGEQEIVVTFGYQDIEGAIDNGATVIGGDEHFDDFESNEPVIGNDAETDTLLPEMDPVITDIISDAKKNGKDVPKNGSLTEGMYHIEKIDGEVNYNVNLSEGDVTLAVEDDVVLGKNSQISVSEPSDGNVFRMYANGDKLALNGDICVNSCSGDATAIQFYGPSTMGVDMGASQGGSFEGLLYVASNENEKWDVGDTGNNDESCQVDLQANQASFTGSLVAFSVCVQSAGESFEYPEEDFKNFKLDAYPDGYSLPPQLTYLNVAVYEMDVDNE